MKNVLVCLGLVVAATFGIVPKARAETVAVVAGGDTQKAAVVIDSMSPWLTDHGYTVALPEATATAALVGCYTRDDEACATPTVTAAGADHFVFVMVEIADESATPGSEGITLTSWMFDKAGTVKRAERRYCEACRIESLARTSEELIAVLLGGETGSATLTITSNPSGARVSFDGTPIGVTPISYKIAPGAHTITLDKDNYESLHQPVQVSPEGSQLELTLKPRTSEPRATGPTRWPIAVAGGLLLGGGIALFALDEDAPTGSTRPSTFRDTATLGLGVAAAGAAAITTYVILRLGDRTADRAPPISAHVGANQATLVWHGQF